MQRKVSHILVKRDQEHLLDDIEDRLAGAHTTTLTFRFLDNSQYIFSVGNHVRFALQTISHLAAATYSMS